MPTPSMRRWFDSAGWVGSGRSRRMPVRDATRTEEPMSQPARRHRHRSGPRHRRRHRPAARPRRLRRRPCSTSTRRPARQVAGGIRDAGGRAVGVGVDVTDAAQVEAGVARVADELGPPVVLVNNAGIIRDNLHLQDDRGRLGRRDGRAPRGAFLMTKAVPGAHDRREVRPHRQPLVVLGAGQPWPGQLLRGEGRPAGLHQDPGHRARQVRRHRQRRGTGLHPDRHDRRHRRPDRGRRSRTSSPHTAQQIPVGRVGQPEDIAATIAFLVSEEAGFVSGQVIYVAGGPLD